MNTQEIHKTCNELIEEILRRSGHLRSLGYDPLGLIDRVILVSLALGACIYEEDLEGSLE